MKHNKDSYLYIGNCLVSRDIITEYYCCDYEKCKGCCCIIGDSGAPLAESELEQIEENYPEYCDLMSEEGRALIDKTGFFDIDIDGDLVTPCCTHEECAYSRIDPDGSCWCAMERSFFNGKSRFRKPVSCWLYPIRVTRMNNGMDCLKLHRWDICKDAFEKGKREKVRVYQFLREPLIHLYGEEFYSTLCEIAKAFIQQFENLK